MTISHTCHIPSCRVEVPPKLLMCRPHWYMVPMRLRSAVWRYFRPGQEQRKFTPTSDYLDAADAAIKYVVKLEKKIL